MKAKRSFLSGRLFSVPGDIVYSPQSEAETGPIPELQRNNASFSCIGNQALFGPMTSISRRAMASDFEILLNDPANDGFEGVSAAQIGLDALDEIDRIETILSVFKPASLVSRINALASEVDIPVSNEFLGWLKQSLLLGEQTGGAFDIASGALWTAWGFARRDGRFPSEAERQEALELSGTEHLTLDEEALVVRLDKSGVILNFGGIGKGIALDCAAQKMIEAGLTDFLLQGGKSGAVARGGRRGDTSIDQNRTLWTIRLADPLRPNRPLAQIRLADRALATSGSSEQFFFHKGKRYSHILNPKTGYPAFGILSATVLAETAAEADALSTAFFVMGVEKTVEFCKNRPDLSVLLLIETDTGAGQRLVAVNMTDAVLAITSPEIPVEIR